MAGREAKVMEGKDQAEGVMSFCLLLLVLLGAFCCDCLTASGSTAIPT